MIWRSKAPFRLGLAGGGTDVSPYSDLFGGAILNATVSLFAHSSLELLDEPVIEFKSIDQNKSLKFPSGTPVPVNMGLGLQCGLYNRLLQNGSLDSRGLRLTTSMDVPPGSGL